MRTIHEELTEESFTAAEIYAVSAAVDTSLPFPRSAGSTRPDAKQDLADAVSSRLSALRIARRDVKGSEGKPTAAKWAAKYDLALVAFVNALKSAV